MADEFKESLSVWQHAKTRYETYLQGMSHDTFPSKEDLLDFLGYLKDHYHLMLALEQRQDFRSIKVHVCNWIDGLYRQPGDPPVERAASGLVGLFGEELVLDPKVHSGKPCLTLTELLQKADGLN